MNSIVTMACGPESAKQIQNSVCVVIDVLRASSTIVTALFHGYEEIIPVNDLNRMTASDLSVGEYLGAQTGKATFGNSPIELLNPPPRNKKLHIMTTNGTHCLLALDKNNTVLIGALLNASAIAHKAYELANANAQTITLLCCGFQGLLEEDDYLAASYIADKLSNLGASIHFKFKKSINLQESLLATPAALRLIQLGSRQDVIFCSETDKYSIVPLYRDGVIGKCNEIG